MNQSNQVIAFPATTSEEPAHLPTTPTRPLRESVAISIGNYFAHLDGADVTEVYDMVLQEIEPPLLEAVLKHTRNNQTKASIVLGLNRGTLRKKLKRYGLI